MTTEKQAGGEFYFISNHLCLDFINTQAADTGGNPVEFLGDFADLAMWSQAAGIISDMQAKKVIENWSSGRKADRVFEYGVKFRAALRDMAARTATGKAVPVYVIDIINELLRERIGYVELVRVKGTYEKRFHADFSDPQHLFVPVAESASDLLTTGDISLIRKCENPRCILYFYDMTKNHQRRWCSMSGCGNRAKAAAHYRRTRSKSTAVVSS